MVEWSGGGGWVIWVIGSGCAQCSVSTALQRDAVPRGVAWTAEKHPDAWDWNHY